MSEPRVAGARIRAGYWEAEISTGSGAIPDIEILHLEKPLENVTVGESAVDGSWPVSAPIPAKLLSDGVQTFVVRDRKSGARLSHFTIVTGTPLEDDIRAELDLLRAELDMLKKAFRRHCLDGDG
ncbi:MAG: hypothetical protein H6901_04965 [Rhodobacteraceae bacterium]|nr:hypothetical protein [Paracoccaceae bacterium]MCP5341551.1 hypothetical protein [Paracoccaceae bacterium]